MSRTWLVAGMEVTTFNASRAEGGGLRFELKTRSGEKEIMTADQAIAFRDVWAKATAQIKAVEQQ